MKIKNVKQNVERGKRQKLLNASRTCRLSKCGERKAKGSRIDRAREGKARTKGREHRICTG